MFCACAQLPDGKRGSMIKQHVKPVAKQQYDETREQTESYARKWIMYYTTNFRERKGKLQGKAIIASQKAMCYTHLRDSISKSSNFMCGANTIVEHCIV